MPKYAEFKIKAKMKLSTPQPIKDVLKQIIESNPGSKVTDNDTEDYFEIDIPQIDNLEDAGNFLEVLHPYIVHTQQDDFIGHYREEGRKNRTFFAFYSGNRHEVTEKLYKEDEELAAEAAAAESEVVKTSKKKKVKSE